MSAHHVTPAQRLAAVVSKCFDTKQAVTQTALRHAVYSKFTGREITRSDELTDDEIKRMLTAYEHHASPFLPSERARRECNEIAKAYQLEHGQVEMAL